MRLCYRGSYLSIVFLDGTGVIAEHHACVLDKIGGVTRQGLIPAKDQIHRIFRDVVADWADVKTWILRFPVIAVLVEDRGREDTEAVPISGHLVA